MRLPRYAPISIVFALSLCRFPDPARAQQYTMLYSFVQNGDGQLPLGPLVADAKGNLYGTTSNGGSANAGTVFQLAPPAAPGGAWTETQLLRFDGAGGGAHPLTGVVFDPNGIVLYGTTSAGGAYGAGVVFSLTPAGHGTWTEAVLYNFKGNPDGAGPNYGPLLVGAEVAGRPMLYGMTTSGGASGAGTAYSLTPPVQKGAAWTETILWSFGNGSTDGASPNGGLVADANGVLYGGTSAGGALGVGTVFSLTPSAHGGGWTEAILYNFQGVNDGATPAGNLLAGTVPGGSFALFGVTSFGGGGNAQGMAFALTPGAAGASWQEQILYRFSILGTRQYNPRSGFALGKGGTLYVTASLGGLGPDGGVISLTPPAAPGGKWTQLWLFHFTGTDGNNPAGGLLYLNNILYGTTYSGGEQNFGVVYSWNLKK
ncbi:MAG: choice-of-anchor tandem repeat GloVer-containing protein [Bryobacteraceae bacterium]